MRVCVCVCVESVCSKRLVLPGPFPKSDSIIQPGDSSLPSAAFEHSHLHGKCGLGTVALSRIVVVARPWARL